MKTFEKIPEGAKQYVKKPIPIKAIQIFEHFEVKTLEGIEVKTLEGIMQGKPGDFLIEGIRGELYPCDMDIFVESYEGISMTDSPINLDEAYKCIKISQWDRKDFPGMRCEVLIEGSYLESIVKELVAARERIAELEGQNRRLNARVAEMEDDNAIIPQADDVHILSEALDLIERNLYYEDNVNSDLCKVIRRYLAAIDGGKP